MKTLPLETQKILCDKFEKTDMYASHCFMFCEVCYKINIDTIRQVIPDITPYLPEELM